MTDAGAVRPPAMLVTRNFPPLVGGMEKLNQQLLLALAVDRPVALCGPAGCSAHAPFGTQVREITIAPLWRFLVKAMLAAIALARRERPAVVVAGSGLTAPMALAVARLVRARSVVYLHGLDLVAPSRVYRWLWLPCIRRCDVALVNSRHTADLATARGVQPQRVHVLHPGTDMPAIDAAAGARWRDTNGLAERDVLISVGRLTRRKGLAEFVRDVLPAIVEQRPTATLVVIGGEATNALHGGGGDEAARIREHAAQAGMQGHVRLLGSCDDAQLAAAYTAADVHVFPVRALQGDVEGFGMVALESAAHGLPTVAYAVGGVPDAVSDGQTGHLVAGTDAARFAQAVVERLAAGRSHAQTAACLAFAAEKAWPRFGERLRTLLDGSA